jgi:hypothetical protein
MLLCNESFASTNERKGSEIARQIVRALLDSGAKVLFVTHQFDLANGFYPQQPGGRSVPARVAGNPRRADVQAAGGRAAADKLRRGPYRRIFGTLAERALASGPLTSPARGDPRSSVSGA